MAGEPFLDINVVLRHLLQDHADHSPRASALFERIGLGEIEVQATPSVVFEAIYVLEKTWRVSKTDIRRAIGTILRLPRFNIVEKSRLERALDLFVERNIPYIDAYHAVAMDDLGCTQIISFDHHYDRIPGIERVEP